MSAATVTRTTKKRVPKANNASPLSTVSAHHKSTDLESQSPLARRLDDDAELRHYLARDVAGEIAEQLIRLRQYRGLSQSALAKAVGTQQAAISRHESGEGNIGAETIETLLQALNAICRIDLVPAEFEHVCSSAPRWWDVAWSLSSHALNVYRHTFEYYRPATDQIETAEFRLLSDQQNGSTLLNLTCPRAAKAEVAL